MREMIINRKKVMTLGDHGSFDFKGATKMMRAYARSKNVVTLQQLSKMCDINLSTLYRQLRVVIIFNLLTEEEINVIADKRCLYANKKGQNLEAVENYIALGEERNSILKKLNVNQIFIKYNSEMEKKLSSSNQMYIERLLEIENIAFR